MDEQTLKKQYRFAPRMLWYRKHCNYEKLRRSAQTQLRGVALTFFQSQRAANASKLSNGDSFQ